MAHRRVLLVGSGGREHALAWKLAESENVGTVYVYPGNAGIFDKIKIVSPPGFPGLGDFALVGDWCLDNGIDLVVVGPEEPLAKGIVDTLTMKGVKCFGPTASASRIEASKDFAKRLMDKYDIPTARWQSFSNAADACSYISSLTQYDCQVVKADGLAAGKGVVICDSKESAITAVNNIMVDRKYGETCGSTVVIEEYLEGFECSLLCFTDGETVLCMPPAQDHKRLMDGNQGPNTGGMGAYCPCTLVSSDQQKTMESIMQRAVTALAAEGSPFKGVLYGGFMVTSQGPKVLEFNCRFGDPETQVLLPLLQSDLYNIMMSCCTASLRLCSAVFDVEKSCVAVVVVSPGYPDSYPTGLPIAGLDNLDPSVQVFHAGISESEGRLCTNGGRVLAVVACNQSLERAACLATVNASKIRFTGAFFRRDIAAAAAFASSSRSPPRLTYADSGVNITAGDELVTSIKPLCSATFRSGCVGDLGLFGSVFDPKATQFLDPLLVSGTDGVGTKLLIAQACQDHHTIGQDLVAMCVNDILCHGAEPLYFLDYFASGRLDVGVANKIIAGIAAACKDCGCALVGGETAEMPGMYSEHKYDIAGFTVGAVERHLYLPRISEVVSGDVVIGLHSSGLHSNGFSLVREVVRRSGLSYSDPCPFDDNLPSLGQALLTPTRLYVRDLLPVLTRADRGVKAVAHITGGGLTENIPRVLPANLKVVLDASCWNIPAVFGWMQAVGDISTNEMSRTFNCGIGMCMVVKEEYSNSVAAEVKGRIIGKVEVKAEGDQQVVIDGLELGLQSCWDRTRIITTKQKRVGVLISGTGTNLQALIDSCRSPHSAATIVFVLSNVEGVKGIERAQAAGIPTKVLSHKGFKSREAFDDRVHEELVAAGVEIVCLAGFMRILSGKFVNRWQGRLINVHPSLLPSFKGMDAHEQVLAAGVKLSGCTVHLVTEEVDCGAILEQEAVPVLPGDTVSRLQERVKAAEHRAFPRALQNLAQALLKN